MAVQWVLFGIFALTAGRYVFLAAGKRGWLDRSGRALIILGYGLVLFGSLSSQPEYEARSALIFADTLGQSSRITL